MRFCIFGHYKITGGVGRVAARHQVSRPKFKDLGRLVAVGQDAAIKSRYGVGIGGCSQAQHQAIAERLG
jgi:hypothetical protein